MKKLRDGEFQVAKAATFEKDAEDHGDKLSEILKRNDKRLRKLDYVEPAYCSAVREVREETGLEVVANKFLYKDDRFVIYSCDALELSGLKDHVSKKPEIVSKAFSASLFEKMTDTEAEAFFKYTNNLDAIKIYLKSLK